MEADHHSSDFEESVHDRNKYNAILDELEK